MNFHLSYYMQNLWAQSFKLYWELNIIIGITMQISNCLGRFIFIVIFFLWDIIGEKVQVKRVGNKRKAED